MYNCKIKIGTFQNMEVYECTSFYSRLTGLMFKKNINYGLLFKRCNSIHTFFMKENIDVIMTDKNNRILYYYKNLKPNKIILPKKNVYNTYEFPINKLVDIKINDIIKIVKDY